MLHEQVVLLHVETEDLPRVPAAERLQIERLELGLYQVVVRYGFMQTPNVPVALRLCEAAGPARRSRSDHLLPRPGDALARKDVGLPLWQDHVFDFLARNAARATAFYRLPPERVIEIGIQVEI